MKNYNEQIISSIVKLAYNNEIEKMALSAKGLLTGLGTVGAVGGAGYLGGKYIEDPEKFKETAGVVGKNIQHAIQHPIDTVDELAWKLKSKEDIREILGKGEQSIQNQRHGINRILNNSLIGLINDNSLVSSEAKKSFDLTGWRERHPNANKSTKSRELLRQFNIAQKGLKLKDH